MITLCTSRGCELIFSELRLELRDMPERFVVRIKSSVSATL